MEAVLKLNGFTELCFDEQMAVDGGGLVENIFNGVAVGAGLVCAYAGGVAASLAIPTLGMSVATAGTVCAISGGVAAVAAAGGYICGLFGW